MSDLSQRISIRGGSELGHPGSPASARSGAFQRKRPPQLSSRGFEAPVPAASDATVFPHQRLLAQIPAHARQQAAGALLPGRANQRSRSNPCKSKGPFDLQRARRTAEGNLLR